MKYRYILSNGDKGITNWDKKEFEKTLKKGIRITKWRK